MSQPSAATHERLAHEPIIWFATVRPTGQPHLVPLWFVWLDGTIYLCMSGTSVKARNLVANPAVALALESGSDPVVLEGQATRCDRPWPEAVIQQFQQKYAWTITTDTEYTLLIAVTPQRWLMVQG